jgi:subtilisin family serine protease
MKNALVALIAVVGTAATAPGALAAPGGGSPPRLDYVPGELIVKFRAGQDTAARTDALSDRGARLGRSLRIARTAVARIARDADPSRAAAALERDPRVAWAQPNWRMRGAGMPNDPFLDHEWGLRNTGQFVYDTTGVAGADIDAVDAWSRTTGSSDVKVAVVDSGISFGQPDLTPNLWRNPGETGNGREHNGIDDDGNGYVDDYRGWDFIQGDNDPSDNFGHGTRVAGLIAARGNDGVGMAGVAWRASVIPVRALDNFNYTQCDSLGDAIAYAVRAGARVVNASEGGLHLCQPEIDAIAAAPNVLFVVSAGNEGHDLEATPEYPCASRLPNIVCVGATDQRDGLAAFSNYGARAVDLAAPGANSFSTTLRYQPKETLFADGFDQPLDEGGRWVSGGIDNTWQRTLFGQRSGTWALSDSPFGPYANDTSSFIRHGHALRAARGHRHGRSRGQLPGAGRDLHGGQGGLRRLGGHVVLGAAGQRRRRPTAVHRPEPDGRRAQAAPAQQRRSAGSTRHGPSASRRARRRRRARNERRPAARA